MNKNCKKVKGHVTKAMQKKFENLTYLGKDTWLEKMAKTHIQKQCPHCNFWVVWIKKK